MQPDRRSEADILRDRTIHVQEEKVFKFLIVASFCCQSRKTEIKMIFFVKKNKKKRHVRVQQQA